MSLFRALLLTACLILPLGYAHANSAAPVQGGASMGLIGAKPLMVIRFNQRNVHFERQLYGTLEQVVRVKPDVMFDLVSAAPEGTAADRAALQQVASQNGQHVLDSLVRMGVPQSRIHYTEVSDPDLRYSEVRLFAH